MISDLTVLFIIFGFFAFCIVLSEMSNPNNQLTFEERTKNYYDSCEALDTAYEKLYSTEDSQEKELLKKEIKQLIKESEHQYCILPREDTLEILKRTADDLEETAGSLEAVGKRLKESNDKLQLSVERMKQKFKEVKSK